MESAIYLFIAAANVIVAFLVWKSWRDERPLDLGLTIASIIGIINVIANLLQMAMRAG